MDKLVWHSLKPDEVLNELKSSLDNGLSSNEVESRKKECGLNELPKAKRASIFIIFLNQFKSPLIYLLLIASIIALGLGHVIDSLVIVVVLLINSLIGTIQTSRAEISMEALRKESRVKVKVVRNGQEETIDSIDLVPGDILLLTEGDSVGADSRIITSKSLQAMEASLTGESSPVWKTVESLENETELADRTNMLFAGTNVTKGRGEAIVIATGVSTEIGRITTLTQGTKKFLTPLEERIHKLSNYILIASFFVFISVILIGWFRHLPLSTIFMVSLSQVVSMVPEGLPVALTVALAVGMQRMARRGAIIRNLSAVETLGSINVICTDKTGTLTRNEMTVTEVLLPDLKKIVTDSELNKEELNDILIAAILCNDAHLTSNKKMTGDPTEVSLLNLAQKAGYNIEEIRNEYERMSEIPFDPETKLMAVEVKNKDNKKIYLKGAPEELLKFCSFDKNDQLHNEIIAMAEQALRLLAFAVIEKPEIDLNNGLEGLKGHAIFLGITGQFDPPRQEVKAAVEKCRSAGIRPILITGDHKITGFAIARLVNIAKDDDIAIDGYELSKLSDEEFSKKLNHVSVFARVHAEQKLKIVTALQKNNFTVAMTGDGVNDAPALAKADIGVAMGITGTEAAKEASKVVITDDNFATIVKAVQEGRLVYQNIKKLLLYIFSTGLSELVVLYTALIFNYPLPLAAVQILWVNLVTDGVLTLPLILQSQEGDEMKRPPIKRNDSLIGREELIRMAFMVPAMAASTLFYFILRLSSDVPFAQVQTGTFTVLAVSQWFNALNCRSKHKSAFSGLFRDRWMLVGIIIGNLLHMAVIYIPILNLMFHTTPIPLTEVFIIGFAASFVLWTEELRKFFYRRFYHVPK